MKKMMFAAAMAVAIGAFADGDDNVAVLVSTAGPDRYLGGETVMGGECYALVCRGLVTGRTIKPSMIADYRPGEYSSVYVHDLFVAEEFRGSGVLLAIAKALSNLAADVQAAGCGIRRVVADPATPEGERLCRAAGMQLVGGSADGRKIYEAYSPDTRRMTFPFGQGFPKCVSYDKGREDT